MIPPKRKKTSPFTKCEECGKKGTRPLFGNHKEGDIRPTNSKWYCHDCEPLNFPCDKHKKIHIRCFDCRVVHGTLSSCKGCNQNICMDCQNDHIDNCVPLQQYKKCGKWLYCHDCKLLTFPCRKYDTFYDKCIDCKVTDCILITCKKCNLNVCADCENTHGFNCVPLQENMGCGCWWKNKIRYRDCMICKISCSVTILDGQYRLPRCKIVCYDCSFLQERYLVI